MKNQLIHLFFALSLGFVGVFMAADLSYAQSNNCAPRADILKRLSNQYHETRQSMGLTHNKLVMELFASPSGNWSLILTRPNGISCFISAGFYFEKTPQPTVQTGKPVQATPI